MVALAGLVRARRGAVSALAVLARYQLASAALTAAACYHAYRTREQFYPATVRWVP